MALERGPICFVSTDEEIIERRSSNSGLESRKYGRRDPSRWPRDTVYLQKLALTSPTRGGRSVGIVRSRTEVNGIFFFRTRSFSMVSVIIVIAAQYIRYVSFFNVCSSCKNCSYAKRSSAVNVFCRHVDVFGSKTIFLFNRITLYS
jgi:hypothetical protein